MVSEKKKLVWLGVKRASQTQSEASSEIEKLKNNVGSYSTFQSDLDAYDLDGDGANENISNFTDFKTYLKDNGFTQAEADDFVTKIRNNFTDSGGDGSKYDDFEDYVQNQSSSYSELKSQFESQASFGSELETEDGEQAAGVRTFENAGVTYDGVSVPAGSVEVFGREVHFSQSGTTKSGSGSGSTGGSATFVYSNIRTDDSDNTVPVGSDITISVDVKNDSTYTEVFVATLFEDGESVGSGNFRLGAGASMTVNFTISRDEYVCHDYKINDSGTVNVCWEPSELIQ